MQLARQDVAVPAAKGLRRTNSGSWPEWISCMPLHRCAAPLGVSADLLHILYDYSEKTEAHFEFTLSLSAGASKGKAKQEDGWPKRWEKAVFFSTTYIVNFLQRAFRFQNARKPRF